MASQRYEVDPCWIGSHRTPRFNSVNLTSNKIDLIWRHESAIPATAGLLVITVVSGGVITLTVVAISYYVIYVHACFLFQSQYTTNCVGSDFVISFGTEVQVNMTNYICYRQICTVYRPTIHKLSQWIYM